MIGSLRARILKLEARQPPATRAFIVCAGTRDQIPGALVAALEALGEVTVVTSGVPRDPLDPDEGPRLPAVHEQVGGAWVAVDDTAIAA
jgi:hypothetical protein